MRDFRDAKAMAQTLRDQLQTKAVTISHSESLELVSRMFGVADWNTLSAMLKATQRAAHAPTAERVAAGDSYPAIPLRDFVPFPGMTFPLFIGREKTMRALDQAFERDRNIVLVVQLESGIDEPGFDDILKVGLLAEMLEVQRLPDRTMKVLAHANQRIVVRHFVGTTGAFQAEASDLRVMPVGDTDGLISMAVKRFDAYAAANELPVLRTWPPLEQIRDAGEVADIIGRHLVVSLHDKQSVLAALDPLARLQKVIALMAQPPVAPAQVEPRPPAGSR